MQGYCSDCDRVHELETMAGCFLAGSKLVNGIRLRVSESIPDDVLFKVIGPVDVVWVMKDGAFFIINRSRVCSAVAMIWTIQKKPK